jgi:glycolate oxidase FAD binding subunit
MLGGFRRDHGGGAHGPAVLEMGGISGVTLYEPGALTLVVHTGTPLAQIDAILVDEGQRLAFEVPDMRALLGREGQSTIGGVVASNASGPRRVQVGACRDCLLGVRFVDGLGRVIKNGGRVMKNVTGYDLVKLLAGSNGVLGVLTEVSLKVQAIPQAQASLRVRDLESDAAIGALAQALGSPFDVSGASHIAIEGRSESLVRVEGMAGSVHYRMGQLKALLGGEVIEGQESAMAWEEIRDVLPFVGRQGAVWRIGVKPSDAPGIAGSNPAIYDWGGGLLWLLSEDTQAQSDALRLRVRALGGHATRVRGDANVPVFQPESAQVAALTAGMRAKFDPRGLFNPGLLG